MNKTKMINALRRGFADRTHAQKLAITQALMRATAECINDLRQLVNETDAAAQRRKAKRRETELDPKPPVKPVRVAEPSKPREPRYSGNHAPSAAR